MPPRPHSGCRVFWSTTPPPTSRSQPRTCRPTVAHRRRHHPQRGFFVARIRRRRPAAETPSIIVSAARLDRWSRFRPQRRSKGRRQEHGRDPRRRVGPVRHPGQRTRPRPDAPRGHDRRHPGQPPSAPTTRMRPNPHCGSASARNSAGRRHSCVPLRPLHLRPHTRGRRRQLAAPEPHQSEVVTVRDQMGRGPFEP